MHSLMEQCEFSNYLFFKFELILKIHFFLGKKPQMLKTFHLDRIKSVVSNVNDIKLVSQEKTPTLQKSHIKFTLPHLGFF